MRDSELRGLILEALYNQRRFGMVAGFKSESRPASIRNTWPERVGQPTVSLQSYFGQRF
jgi:hypothetical protein